MQPPPRPPPAVLGQSNQLIPSNTQFNAGLQPQFLNNGYQPTGYGIYDP